LEQQTDFRPERHLVLLNLELFRLVQQFRLELFQHPVLELLHLELLLEPSSTCLLQEHQLLVVQSTSSSLLKLRPKLRRRMRMRYGTCVFSPVDQSISNIQK
jgi:hypothetical protein